MSHLSLFGFLFIPIASFFFIGMITNKYGIPPSISSSVDDLSHRKDYIFRWYVWGLAISIACLGQDLTFYTAAGFLTLVSIFIDLHTKWKKVIHTIGAVTGITLTFVGILLVNPPIGVVIILPSLLFSGIIAKYKIPNPIFWVEIICVINIYIGFIILALSNLIN